MLLLFERLFINIIIIFNLKTFLILFFYCLNEIIVTFNF